MTDHDREHKKIRTDRESKARTNALLFGVLFGGVYGYGLAKSGLFDRKPQLLPIDHFARNRAESVNDGLRALAEELGVDPEKLHEREHAIRMERWAPQGPISTLKQEAAA